MDLKRATGSTRYRKFSRNFHVLVSFLQPPTLSFFPCVSPVHSHSSLLRPFELLTPFLISRHNQPLLQPSPSPRILLSAVFFSVVTTPPLFLSSDPFSSLSFCLFSSPSFPFLPEASQQLFLACFSGFWFLFLFPNPSRSPFSFCCVSISPIPAVIKKLPSFLPSLFFL